MGVRGRGEVAAKVTVRDDEKGEQHLTPVSLDESSHHLLRRFASGEVRDEVRVRLLDVVDPARATRGKHREGTCERK